MRIAILANGDSLSNFGGNQILTKPDQVWGLNQQAGIKLLRPTAKSSRYIKESKA